MTLPVRLLTIVSWLLAALLAAVPAGAATEDPAAEVERGRLAIVIGNSNYDSARYEDLANAGNDARKLRRLNFEVATGIDLTAAQTAELLARYEGKLNQYSAVLIFYAGHGVQFNGENFLLPVDSLDPESVEALTKRATSLNDVIARFASRDRQTFIFLDACRNNPLGSGTAGTGNGLAQVEVGENAFIAFSTKPGFVTVDGTGANSPFTQALLENVEIPGLSISDMMIRVRNETERLTLGRQVPWDQSNLREQFYFTEQQVLDSQELSATLNRILEVPAMKDKLLVQLASADNDLQSAVLMLGRQLPQLSRSVEVPGAKSAAAEGQQVASLAQGDLDGSRKAVASDIQSLLVLGRKDEADGKSAAFDLNHRLQTELARVGCYRSAIDGVWGSGSRRALGEYLRRTKQEQTSLEPDVEMLGDLFLRSGRICKEPVAVKPVKTATMSSRDDASKARSATKSGKAGTKGNAKATARSKPAAPPPDIGAGIGIGGVF
jgi:hypothetical protein